MRDPRAQAVSTFYHTVVNNHIEKQSKVVGTGQETVDEFVMAALPALCHWMTIRYFLFAGLMADQSTLFWYAESLADPWTWHMNWLSSVGLHLPAPVVEVMSNAASNGKFMFSTPGRNEHPGEIAPENEEVARSWKDGLSPHLMKKMDVVMHKWLPPAIRYKINAMPE